MSDLFTLAPEGHVYVCCACGKRSRTRAGFDEAGNRTAINSMWDESCMMHAELFPEARLKIEGGRVVEVLPEASA